MVAACSAELRSPSPKAVLGARRARVRAGAVSSVEGRDGQQGMRRPGLVGAAAAALDGVDPAHVAAAAQCLGDAATRPLQHALLAAAAVHRHQARIAILKEVVLHPIAAGVAVQNFD